MSTVGKFSLFILVVLATGCVDKKRPPEGEAAPEAVEAPPEGAEEEPNLETRCFEGDQAACDELGH